MIHTGNDYVHGSVVEKQKYDVYENNKVLKAKKTYKSNSKKKFKTILYVLTIFALMLLIMIRYAYITELNYNLDKMEKNYEVLKNENQRLIINIEKDIDLQKIKQTAEEKLGMHKPDKYQVVYVDLRKDDVTLIADKYMDVGSEGGDRFSALVKGVGKLIQLLE